ncbi:DsbA family oxidoreductase [Nocardia miyunensis]|uniref:DsbA family oxidoreductase n=1 Tax=Nocardia miyunensis TaxID=282684 RepID=UPI000A42C5CE|nr:DsbA family protein [Nocardia miyunensis]
MTLAVVEYTDPVCPWAWGSEPTFRRLRLGLPEASWRRVFGILFDTDDDPAPDPHAELLWYRERLAGIGAHTNAPMAELAWMTSTSRPASWAAKAAEAQGGAVADRVLRRLRESAFVLGRPADTTERALAATAGVASLDHARLAADIDDPAVHEAVSRDWAETRQPLPDVLDIDAPGPHNGRAKETFDGHRYAFPTLVFHGRLGHAVVAGWHPYEDYLAAVRAVEPELAPAANALDPAAALERFGSLTEPELMALTGFRAAPEYAVAVTVGGATVWLHPDEAATHPALRL